MDRAFYLVNWRSTNESFFFFFLRGRKRRSSLHLSVFCCCFTIRDKSDPSQFHLEKKIKGTSHDPVRSIPAQSQCRRLHPLAQLQRISIERPLRCAALKGPMWCLYQKRGCGLKADENDDAGSQMFISNFFLQFFFLLKNLNKCQTDFLMRGKYLRSIWLKQRDRVSIFSHVHFVIPFAMTRRRRALALRSSFMNRKISFMSSKGSLH